MGPILLSGVHEARKILMVESQYHAPLVHVGLAMSFLGPVAGLSERGDDQTGKDGKDAHDHQ